MGSLFGNGRLSFRATGVQPAARRRAARSVSGFPPSVLLGAVLAVAVVWLALEYDYRSRTISSIAAEADLDPVRVRALLRSDPWRQREPSRVSMLAGFGDLRILTQMGVAQRAPAVEVAATEMTGANQGDASDQPESEGEGEGDGTTADDRHDGQDDADTSDILFAFVDVLFTGLLLMGGANTVAKAIESWEARRGIAADQRPVEVTGSLRLDSDPRAGRDSAGGEEGGEGEAAGEGLAAGPP